MFRRIALSAFALLSVAGTASAAPLLLPGDSPIYFQFNNIEQVNGANSLVVPGYAPAAAYLDGLQGNWGLFNISSVQNGFALPAPPNNDIAGGPTFFSDDGPGGVNGQITGIFYGIDFTSPTTATNGRVDLYWQEAGTDTIDASCLAGVGCLPDAGAVDRFTTNGGAGIFLATLDFASGIIPGDDMTTLSSTTDPTTQGGSGLADSFANVNTSFVGAWTDILNGNWFFIDSSDAGAVRGDSVGETRDIRFSTFFNANLETWDAGPAGTQGLRSNDPARVFTVPEPATLTLLGLAFVGLSARRRKNAL